MFYSRLNLVTFLLAFFLLPWSRLYPLWWPWPSSSPWLLLEPNELREYESPSSNTFDPSLRPRADEVGSSNGLPTAN